MKKRLGRWSEVEVILVLVKAIGSAITNITLELDMLKLYHIRSITTHIEGDRIRCSLSHASSSKVSRLTAGATSNATAELHWNNGLRATHAEAQS